MIHILRLPGAAAIVLGLASVIYKNLFHTASFSRSCRTISSTISSQSDVYYPGASVYHTDIYHWASSSTQEPACTVEPGTAEDVGEILRILGQTRTPFAVKSGGHTANPNFSSSKGVLIALYRFNEVVYDPESQTATIGTGLIFDDVYAALEPHKVSVLGARVTGIGVGGFVLGGGYSWKTNQYGLAVDSITSFELVKPNGEVTNVTESTDSELFFGLKGGFNNFGIVTRVTMRTYPQPMVWGGMITYTKYSIAEVTAAVIKFSATNTDPKANIIAGYDCVLTEPLITQLLYYDGPNPPAGLFDDFLKIPALIKDIGQRSLHKYIKLTASNVSADFHLGAVFHTVPLLGYSARVMDTVQSELTFWCDALALDATPFISYDIEPFLPTILSHNELPTAYPPTRDKAYMPLNIYFAWALDVFDDSIFGAIKRSAARIRDAAIADGQNITDAPLYPNYAIFDTPLNEMYGSNVDKLKALKRSVDPSNVMGLAGGFKF